MKAEEAATRIKEAGIIAILRGAYSERQVVEIAETLQGAGVFAIEVTLNSNEALSRIELLRQRFPELLVGAGTVRDLEETSAALNAGAHFLVSPNLDRESVACSIETNVLHIPGIFTATEAQVASASGCRMVKLFPASAVGPEYLAALRAPLDDIDFVPTGGITHGNVPEYIAAGAVAVGVGSSLVAQPGQDEQELRERALAFTAALTRARSAGAT
jgi:2-dehydro-3-deoxyphosphogluconate aldolase/(4S)-4-hydroxy-2-oxoglutarate aldolase